MASCASASVKNLALQVRGVLLVTCLIRKASGMVVKEYANFEPKTKIPEADFFAEQEKGGIKFSKQHCLAVENALKEYERFCYLTKMGEGQALPAKLRKLEDTLRCMITSVDAVSEEEGNIWEDLLYKSDAKISSLERLLDECEKLNRKIPKLTKPQRRKRLLNRLVSNLANIYTAATGKRATISKGAPSKRDPFLGGRGGRFPLFLRTAVKYLPDECRPADKTITGIASRFERMKKEEKAGRAISPNWIGLPYPGLARPNWKESVFRRLTGKRP
jgi:hypothetical protein